MPFYEYECSACKFYVEALQKISDPPLTKCPSCGKESLQRLISAPVFRLKGSGWYETDFKSDKENKRNLADGSEPAAAADSDDKKVKVRASKALKKVAAKKVIKKAAGKKTATRSTKQPAQKPAKKKPAAKSPVKKAPAKKTGKGKPANKTKTPVRKQSARKKK